MSVWIEVAGGDGAWKDKLLQHKETKRGLRAPAATRYQHLLEVIEPGDLLLTYLTLHRTTTREWRSAIVGISEITSRMTQVSHTLKIETGRDTELVHSIKFSEFKSIPELSENFRKAIGFCMQRYIVGISEADFRILAAIYPENESLLRSEGFL